MSSNSLYKIIGFYLIINFANSKILGQTIQISQNKKEEFKKNYFLKESEKDTVYIVFNSQQEGIVSVKETHMPDSYRFKYFRYEKTYPENVNNSKKFIIYHNAGPVWGHEEFIVDKWGINPLNVILEEEKDFFFWWSVEGYLLEYTVIMVEKMDWQNKCRYVKGIQVSIGPLHVTE